MGKVMWSLCCSQPCGLTDAGDVVDYQVEVVNTGNNTLTGLLVTDPLTGGTLTSGASLAPGHTLDFLPTYTLTQSELGRPPVEQSLEPYVSGLATEAVG